MASYTFDLSTDKGLHTFEQHISTRQFVHGGIPTQSDVRAFKQLGKAPGSSFPNTTRFFRTMTTFTGSEINGLPIVRGEEQSQTSSAASSASVPSASTLSADSASDLTKQVEEQGLKVRQLKTSGAAKADVDREVQLLLDMKKRLAEQSGKEGATSAPKATPAQMPEPTPKAVESQPEPETSTSEEKADDGSKSKNQLKKEAKAQKVADKKSGKSSTEHETRTVGLSTATKETFQWSPAGTLVENIKLLFAKAVSDAFPDANIPEIRAGHRGISYQINTALDINQMASALANVPSGGPIAIAEKIISFVPHNNILSAASVTTAGFIVVDLDVSNFLKGSIANVVRKGVLPPPQTYEPMTHTVAVDFSSPNIAKQMHVGHLRSTIIGDTISKLYEFCQCKVERINHVGDWGTQFGMLLCHLEDTCPGFINNQNVDIGDLTNFYRASKDRFDKEDGFKKRAQERVVKLQAGEPTALAMWNFLCDISRKQFMQIYSRLHITIKETGESFYNSMIPSVIAELQSKGIVEESAGALCVFVDRNSLPPLMLRKSDGGFGYDATDAAAIYYRIHTLKADTLIYITDSGQGEHFKLVFETARRVGWIGSRRVDHIGFGLVLDENGQKFKTRSGDTVPLIGLLDEAVERMTRTLIGRIEEGRCPLTKEEVGHAADVIGHASVKYFDLRQNPTSNYVFSYDKMLDDKGDTAVYLLYTRARINSILRKAEAEHSVVLKDLIANADSLLNLAHETEVALAVELTQFQDMVRFAIRDLQPNQICKYVYDLSVAYSKWNNRCKVLGSEEMKSRLLLTYATMVTMDRCFDLLGIKPLDKI
eukprot:c6460_g1_i2.p1 GENE.c6460_g1_i2~~c6460_g1_i2.p1  ORF type:complete len:861 (+),score=223.58 c6460_g1_i2:109-2583(+)